MAEQHIEIENLAAIQRLDIPIEPGVVILRGANGCGKTTAIDAVRKLVGGDNVTAAPRDGEARATVAMGGARLVISGKSVRKGRLEVEAIEDRVNIGKLVNPGIKDPERADAARLKILVHLFGVEADIEPYHRLVEGVMDPDSLIVQHTDDPVIMAQRVKEAIEAYARTKEAQAADRKSRAGVLDEQTREIDVSQPHDAEELRAATQKATIEFQALQQKKKDYENLVVTQNAAKEQLAAMSDDEPTLDECGRRTEQLRGDAAASQQVISKLREDLLRQEEHQKAIFSDIAKSQESFRTAQQRESRRLGLQQTIENFTLSEVTADDVHQAGLRLRAAYDADEHGAVVREAIKRREQYSADMLQHAHLTEMAERYRDLAASVEDVLTEQLPLGSLRVQDGRIVTDETDRECPELFAELSRGERTRMAIDLAANNLLEGGILTLDQESWEGLDPKNQRSVIGQAKSHGITILTAKADDGKLRAEVAR